MKVARTNKSLVLAVQTLTKRRYELPGRAQVPGKGPGIRQRKRGRKNTKAELGFLIFPRGKVGLNRWRSRNGYARRVRSSHRKRGDRRSPRE